MCVAVVMVGGGTAEDEGEGGHPPNNFASED